MVQENRAVQEEALQIREGQVVVGSWSKELMQVVAQSARLRAMLREDRVEEARAFLQGHRAEEQAALVAFDADPEQVLALTGMDARGKPAYQPAVVDLLPAEILAGLIAPPREEGGFNVEILRALSPEVFARTVDETLEPIYQQTLRTQVSWEWLEAVAALGDAGKAAALLRQVDPEMLEDALLDRLETLDLNGIFGANGVSVPMFTLYSESGGGLALPLIDDPDADPEILAVLHLLYESVPDLLAAAVRKAWERAEEGGER